MVELDTPVLDNHLHLNPTEGRGLDAVEAFARVGGTHLLIVNRPSWHLVGDVDHPDEFRSGFETTVRLVERATEALPGRAWPVLGVHPALISRLVDRGYDPDEAAELMRSGLDIAATYLDGPALALKSGRPHYDVEESVWEASNDVLRHALSLGAEYDVAVQLHTEPSTDLREIADWARAVGLDPERVVKHYAAGELSGVTPSVMSDRDRLRTAANRVEPFLMETDFLDDPDRPGAVLGPKTVPRRVRWLLEEGFEEAVDIAHVRTPERVYGVQLER